MGNIGVIRGRLSLRSWGSGLLLTYLEDAGLYTHVDARPRLKLLIFWALLACFLIPATSASAAGEESSAAWFRSDRVPELAAITVVVVTAVAAIWLARRRVPRFRTLPPLAAIDDAVGRATEMGTPVLYTTGWGGDMGRPTTMASMAILARVASTAAAHNSRLVVPTHDPVIASVAQDTVQAVASATGRPEWASETQVSFVTQSQFGYAAAVDGIIAREKPGAAFLLGSFEGEALILAEAAHQHQAVTIAGTDSTIQLSFFLVACDYTLIGEELYVASGLLSDDGRLLRSIWAQDWLKLTILAVLLGGGALALALGTDLGYLLAP